METTLFVHGTELFHPKQSRRKYAICHMMLYGHRLPEGYQRNFDRLHMERESRQVYWQMICDIYRYVDDVSLSWLDTYDEQLLTYFDGKYNKDRWSYFYRLYPIMIALHGLEGVQDAVFRNQKARRYMLDVHFEYRPFSTEIMDYRIAKLDNLGLDFNLIENFNRASEELQNKYLKTIIAYVTKDIANKRYSRENRHVNANVTRHDFWLTQLRIKNVEHLFTSVTGPFSPYIFEWLMNSTQDPFQRLRGLCRMHPKFSRQGWSIKDPFDVPQDALASETPYYLILEGQKPNDTFAKYLERLLYNKYNHELHLIHAMDFFTEPVTFEQKIENIASICTSQKQLPHYEESLIL